MTLRRFDRNTGTIRPYDSDALAHVFLEVGGDHLGGITRTGPARPTAVTRP